MSHKTAPCETQPCDCVFHETQNFWTVNEAETGAEHIDPTLKATGWGVVEEVVSARNISSYRAALKVSANAVICRHGDSARRGPVVSEKILNRLSRHPGNAISPDDTELALFPPAPCRHLRDSDGLTILGTELYYLVS